MKIIEHTQNSPEWLKWRSEGLGASDIPVIMGSNPYKTKLELWEEKCGFREPPTLNHAMMHGMVNEPIAREWLNNNLNLDLQNICIEGTVNYFKASLDGWDFNKKILYEIKCPVSAKTIEKARIEGETNPYWIDQVQWQMMLSCAKKAYIAIWDSVVEDCILIEVKKDVDLQNEMKYEAKKFWESIVAGKSPDLSDKDFIEIEDENLEKLIIEYKELADTEKEIKERKKALKNNIVAYGDDGNFKAYGAKIKRCVPIVTYDIKKMKDDGIDIEKYKKESSSIGYYKITLPR